MVPKSTITLLETGWAIKTEFLGPKLNIGWKCNLISKYMRPKVLLIEFKDDLDWEGIGVGGNEGHEGGGSLNNK